MTRIRLISVIFWALAAVCLAGAATYLAFAWRDASERTDDLSWVGFYFAVLLVGGPLVGLAVVFGAIGFSVGTTSSVIPLRRRLALAIVAGMSVPVFLWLGASGSVFAYAALLCGVIAVWGLLRARREDRASAEEP